MPCYLETPCLILITAQATRSLFRYIGIMWKFFNLNWA